MKIDGKEIAGKIYEELQKKVGALRKNGVIPHLCVFLVGNVPASVAYVNQKKKWGEYIGAKITIIKYPDNVSNKELIKSVKELNNDPEVHAILIQRPLPPQIDVDKLELLVDPQKDIDGFHPDSPYTLPLPLAVVKILEEIYKTKFSIFHFPFSIFIEWLQKQKIVVIGKGPTGGGPIINYLRKLGLNPVIIDSKTKNAEKIMKSADIIISAVGKTNIVTAKNLKRGVILVGAGILRGEDGKLQGDYDEEEIEKIAGFYTPTPGGVGPVNVAMLMENLLSACERQNHIN